IQFDAIYARLGVKFDHALGESFYNPKLHAVVDDLKASGLAHESEGAMIVSFDDVPQLKDKPALVQKSDGGFNYTTTDLATLQHRIETWHPQEIIYVTDGRQQLHFQQLFTIFRRWRPDVSVKLAHVWFGSILGDDGKPLKTRSGETVKLANLLDEAEERAFKVVREKTPDAPEELALAKHLLNFGITLDAAAEDYRPNLLCNYLYELAGHFARFYEACPVLKAEGDQRAARFTLCDVTARVLKQGLDVLGIEVLEQM